MKKKKILLFILCMFLCSCRKIVDNKTIDDFGSYGYYLETGVETFNCDEIKNAVSINNDHFLTNNGDIYRYNKTKLFSNDKNCIKTDYSNESLMYIYNKGVFDKNHNLIFILFDDKKILTPSEFKDEFGSDYHILEVIKNNDFDFISYNDCAASETLIVKDNEVFWIDYKEDKHSLGVIPKSERIIYMSGALIKTDKSFWSLEKINSTECNKYVDVECEYKFVKSSLTEKYNKIVFASQDMLIDDSNRVYNKGFCFDIE